LGERARAGLVAAVEVRVEAEGEVAVEVDAVGVLACVVGDAVRVDRQHRPQVGALEAIGMGAAEGADDPVALTRVAVDRADDEDVEAGGRITGAADDQRPIADGVAEDLALRGPLEAGAGGPGRQRRSDREREQCSERRRYGKKTTPAHARAMPASATPCSNRSR